MSRHLTPNVGASRLTPPPDASTARALVAAVRADITRRAAEKARRQADRERRRMMEREFDEAQRSISHAFHELIRSSSDSRFGGSKGDGRAKRVALILEIGQTLRAHPDWYGGLLDGGDGTGFQLIRAAVTGISNAELNSLLVSAEEVECFDDDLFDDSSGWRPVSNHVYNELLTRGWRMAEQNAIAFRPAHCITRPVTPPEPPPASSHEPTPPIHASDPDELDDASKHILKYLSDRNPRRLTNEQIAAGATYSKRTVADRMPRLLALGLVERPSGQKSGTKITSLGIAIVASTIA